MVVVLVSEVGRRVCNSHGPGLNAEPLCTVHCALCQIRLCRVHVSGKAPCAHCQVRHVRVCAERGWIGIRVAEAPTWRRRARCDAYACAPVACVTTVAPPPPIARSLPYQCFPTIITQCATRHDLATKLPYHTYAYHAASFMAYDTLCVLNVRCFAIKATNQRLLGPTWNTRAPPGWRPSETIPWGTVYSCQGRRCLPGRSRCLRCPRHT